MVFLNSRLFEHEISMYSVEIRGILGVFIATLLELEFEHIIRKLFLI